MTIWVSAFEFQSTLPARGATTQRYVLAYLFPISIHAPREGSDAARRARRSQGYYFNPRSPRGERPLAFDHQTAVSVFQSTLPARGATIAMVLQACLCPISIHAPREGSDKILMLFNKNTIISIHAPREGSDQFRSLFQPCSGDFNPRSPRGERQWSFVWGGILANFNPRSPRGERPYGCGGVDKVGRISIHAPREGSDPPLRIGQSTTAHFNPRSPRGERPLLLVHLCYLLKISIHAPREGSDERQENCPCWVTEFQSTLPARGATSCNRANQK